MAGHPAAGPESARVRFPRNPVADCGWKPQPLHQLRPTQNGLAGASLFSVECVRWGESIQNCRPDRRRSHAFAAILPILLVDAVFEKLPFADLQVDAI